MNTTSDVKSEITCLKADKIVISHISHSCLDSLESHFPTDTLFFFTLLCNKSFAVSSVHSCLSQAILVFIFYAWSATQVYKST